MFNGKIEPQRAAAMGKHLYNKYDYDRKGHIDKNQCYTMFADFIYRPMVLIIIQRHYKIHPLTKIVIQCLLSWIITETIKSHLKILKL